MYHKESAPSKVTETNDAERSGRQNEAIMTRKHFKIH